MKKLVTMLAVGMMGWFGTAVDADARQRGGCGYNSVPQSTIYVSGYHYGRPIYTEKYFVGYDRWGRPVFKYRTVQAPRQQRCRTSYYSSGGYGGYSHYASGGYGGHDYYNPRNSGSYTRYSYCR